MNAVQELAARLRALEDDLKRRSALITTPEGARSFGMALLVSDPKSPSEPIFLKLLRRVLVERDDTLDRDDGSLRKDLQGWLGKGTEELHTLSNWLKIAIEDFPLRLFVAIDPAAWEKGGQSLLNDGSWQGADAFFRKRICWLRAEDLLQDLNSRADNASGAHAFLTRLRMRWIRHLGLNVAKAWAADSQTHKLHILVRLLDSDSSKVDRLDVPDTLPAIWSDTKGKPASATGKGHLVLDLDGLSLTAGQWKGTVGAPPGGLSSGERAALVLRHDGAADIGDDVSDQAPPGDQVSLCWGPDSSLFGNNTPFLGIGSKTTSEFFAALVFQAAVSGAGRSFSLLDSEISSSASPGLTILDMAEQALLRLGIADERFQEWYWKRAGAACERQRGWVIAQRVTPLFLGGPGEFGQVSLSGSPHVRLSQLESGSGDELFCFDQPSGLSCLWREDERELDAIVLHQGLLDKVFAGEKTSQGLTARILQLKSAFPFVFVTSGRGRPENLPSGCRFVPYASLEGAIHGPYFEKLILWRALAAA